jgi:hypothetical protein
MAKFTKSLFLATSALGLASLFAGSAQAGSITGATPGGGTSLVYCSNGTNTFKSGTELGSCTLDQALAGSATSPGGNIELNATSETGGGISTATTLTGNLNGTAITLSSLTAADWGVFGKQWMAELLQKAIGLSAAPTIVNTAYTMFGNMGGFNRFSDPNISYVNQDDVSGLVSIGLAGHLNATDIVKAALPNSLKSLIPNNFQVSEIVKYTYDGVTDYLWSFEATNSGLVEAGDKVSHSGNYEVSFQGKPVEKVPEPATVLGLMAVGSLMASRKRK